MLASNINCFIISCYTAIDGPFYFSLSQDPQSSSSFLNYSSATIPAFYSDTYFIKLNPKLAKLIAPRLFLLLLLLGLFFGDLFNDLIFFLAFIMC